METYVIDPSDGLWSQTLTLLRHDFYHLPRYVQLEAGRLKARPEAFLCVDDDKVFFVPYLLRPCADVCDFSIADAFDVVSPYGYPGILLSEAAAKASGFLATATDTFLTTLRDRQVCSAFLRLHPLLNYGFEQSYPAEICQVTGETVVIDLRLPEDELWHQTRPAERRGINRCKREGFVAKMVRPELYLDAFMAIYEETMDRVQAVESYYFDRTYFLNLIDALGERLHLCIVEFEQQIACASLMTECQGIVQYHLSGTRNDFFKQSPAKIMLDYTRFWAKERGNQFFHLGGGLGGTKDRLYHFKAGFSKQSCSFSTMRIIVNESQYSQLVKQRAKQLGVEGEQLMATGYFPAYRSFIKEKSE